MTAQVTMLTDEAVVAEASIYSLNMQETIHEEEPGRFQAFEVGIAARSFHDGARFASDRYEARLAEDAKVRAALWVALNSLTLNGAGIWKAFEPEIREVVGRANYSAVSESFDKAALALAAAKERA